MLAKVRFLVLALLSTALIVSSVQGDLADSLKKGTPELKSIGPITFGPDGVLFVGDPQGGAVFAIDTGDKANPAASGAVKIAKIDEKIAAMIGSTPKDILINGLAVNPASGNVYLSVSRGKGPTGAPVLVKIDRQGKITAVELKDVKFARAELPSASESKRQEAITCLAYVKGKVLVAGLSNENWASTLRSLPFPFTEANKPTQVQIFHGAHGKFETAAPVRTFVPFDIKGETHILAAYTCTPLVKFPISELKPGQQVKGTTVAELGNGNRPLDMIAYEKGGKQFLLLANSKRGVMKIKTEGLDEAKSIVEPVKGGGPAGQSYETIKDLGLVEHLAKLDKENAVILKRDADGSLNIDTVPLP
jgi:hypothetical protein